MKEIIAAFCLGVVAAFLVYWQNTYPDMSFPDAIWECLPSEQEMGANIGQ